MQNAIITATEIPTQTMSVDSIAYNGRNGIRRNVAKTTSLYIGKGFQDQSYTIAPEATVQIPIVAVDPADKTQCVHLYTSQPLELTLDGGIELSVRSVLTIDHPIGTLSVKNPGCLPALVTLAYLV